MCPLGCFLSKRLLKLRLVLMVCSLNLPVLLSVPVALAVYNSSSFRSFPFTEDRISFLATVLSWRESDGAAYGLCLIAMR